VSTVAGFVILGGMPLSGVEPDTGVEWKVTSIDWWNSPAPTPASTKRPNSHGVWVGESWLPGRTVAIVGTMTAPTPAAGEDAANRLARAAALTDTLLQVASPLPLSVVVRRSGDVIATPQEGQLTVWKWSVQLLAADPRKLGDPLQASTGLPSTSGGLALPFTLPTPISASVVSGLVSLTNPGSIAGPARLRIDGPVSGPIVTHVTSGRSLIFASSLELGAGEFLTVDMERRQVLAQGESSRNGWVTSRGWSAFEPGSNTWAFTSVGSTTGGLLTVTATPAWM
jgi:hypothetical protein